MEYLGLQLAEFGTKCFAGGIHSTGAHSLPSNGMDTDAGAGNDVCAGNDVFLQHCGGACSQAILRSSSRLGA